MKIVSRLRWKLPFLAEAYRLATLSPDVTEVSEIAHAEIMFKIDFHEYYALLERAIVHLILYVCRYACIYGSDFLYMMVLGR